jgi:heme-degrading monooxygenase HmoA
MHVRITGLTGVNDIDAVVSFVRDEAKPQLQQQHGFRGMTVSADRSARVVGVLSIWDTDADLRASDGVATKVRGEGVAAFGGEATVETFEQTVAEVATPPGPDSRLQIRRISMDPSRVEDNIAFFKSTVLPDIKAQPGFQAVRQLIDRATGHGIVGTTWADMASLEAAAAHADEQRQRATDRGVEFGEVSVREILFSAV